MQPQVDGQWFYEVDSHSKWHAVLRPPWTLLFVHAAAVESSQLSQHMVGFGLMLASESAKRPTKCSDQYWQGASINVSQRYECQFLLAVEFRQWSLARVTLAVRERCNYLYPSTLACHTTRLWRLFGTCPIENCGSCWWSSLMIEGSVVRILAQTVHMQRGPCACAPSGAVSALYGTSDSLVCECAEEWEAIVKCFGAPWRCWKGF